MGAEELQQWRRERLKAAAKKIGGKASLGRKLGYRDGAFVGQMLAGIRPITEKTVTAVEAIPGYRGWFAGTSNAPPPPGENFDAPDATDLRFLENLSVIKLDPEQLEEVMEYVSNKAAKLRALQQVMEERLRLKYGITAPPAKHSADAKKTAIARAALDITEQLRQRSLLDEGKDK